MSFGDAVQSCFSKYATFEGRSARSEFWWFYVFTLIVGLIIDVLTNVSGSSIIAVLTGIISLAILLPSLAVGARRLHDIGRTGWWLLISLTFIGVLVLIYWWAQPGESGSNAYGAPPA